MAGLCTYGIRAAPLREEIVAKRKKKNAILGLDLGTQAIKAVEMTRIGDDLSVTGCSYEPVDDPGNYESILKDVMREGKFNPKHVMAALPVANMRVAVLPPDAMDDLDMAVLEEAEKHIPNIEEMKLEYHVFDDDNPRNVKALIVAAREEDIDERIALLESVGIKPIGLDVEALALANAYEIANAGGMIAEENKPAMQVNFGARKTLISISDGSNCVFAESVGGNELTEMIAGRLGLENAQAEELKLDWGDREEDVKDAIWPGIEDLIADITRAMGDYKHAAQGKEVGVLVLSGGLTQFKGIVPLIGSKTKVETKVFDSFGAVDADDLDQDFIREYAHELQIAFGLACHANL